MDRGLFPFPSNSFVTCKVRDGATLKKYYLSSLRAAINVSLLSVKFVVSRN